MDDSEESTGYYHAYKQAAGKACAAGPSPSTVKVRARKKCQRKFIPSRAECPKVLETFALESALG